MALVRTRLLTLVALLALPIAAGAQPAPYHHWRTLETPHFRVHARAGLEHEARVAAAAAEKAYGQLSRELPPPRDVIQLVVSDDADISNGATTVFPSPRIFIFTTPPVDIAELRLNDDWIGIVVTHELTHAFHLDDVGGVWAGAQSIFGRVPFLFPFVYQPTWIAEGLAVYSESRLTEGGRLRGDLHRLIARNAALDQAVPRMGDLSAGSPRFPNGGIPYVYGSLFIEYLAHTYGDTAIRHFIDATGGQLNPFAIGRASRTAFGISLEDAYDVWRDSVRHSVTTTAPPLPGWRDLSTQGYDASDPRWLTDSSFVYTASDGRDVGGAYEMTTSGARRRIGRRNSDGPSVPMPGGGLLFAQIDYTTTSELRTDLYVERDGRTRQLTHDAHLTQPDISRDGTIAAVQVAPDRASLVLLDADGGNLRVLRDAAPDETWSEPRWSPDGRSVAASHRAHGGRFSIEIVPRDGGAATVVARERFVLSSPVWSRTDSTLFYISERTSTPGIEAWSGGRDLRVPALPDSSLIALGRIAISPGGGQIAGVTLHADGYHVGVAPMPALRPLAGASSPAGDSVPVTPEPEPVAAGGFSDYSPWATLLPTAWLPYFESAPEGGARLGATTWGTDVLGRHEYAAWAAAPTSGRFYVGGFSYRYSGLRVPYIDIWASQNWDWRGPISMSTGGSLVSSGNVFERKRDAALAATFYRPRARSYTWLVAGVGMEQRAFATDPEPLLAQIDPSFSVHYNYPRLFVGAAWGNARHPLLSVSPEDGVALAVTARERWSTIDAGASASTAVVGTAAGYRSFDTRGYAHSVLAMRVAAGVSDARTLSVFEVGGTEGNQSVANATVDEGSSTFGVRGFPSATIYGTNAMAGSIEYRAPLDLMGRGLSSFPVFFDRTAASLFADAGTAGCVANRPFAGMCSATGIIGRTIASVGAEVALSLGVLVVDHPMLTRLGIAVPVVVPEAVKSKVPSKSVYIGFGLAY